MISLLSLLTMVFSFLSHRIGTVYLPAVCHQTQHTQQHHKRCVGHEGHPAVYINSVFVQQSSRARSAKVMQRICLRREGKGREGKGREGKGREGKGREGKGREGKGREGKGREGKGREGKGREGKGREGKGREGKGREGKGREGKTAHFGVNLMRCQGIYRAAAQGVVCTTQVVSVMSSDDNKQESVTLVMSSVQQHFTGHMLAAGDQSRTASTTH